MTRKNIAIISLGSGGTMGHMALTTHLADFLNRTGHNVSIVSEDDYGTFSNTKNSRIDLLKIRKQRHAKTIGGCLSYKYKKDLINILKSKNIDTTIFSTFYDLEIIKYLKELGIKSYLISYPLRDSHREAIICRKYYSHFEKVFTLNDIFSIGEKYPNEILVEPLSNKKQLLNNPKKIVNILFTCGGGGRPSSNRFFKLIKTISPQIAREYPQVKMTVIRGNSNFNLSNKNLKTIRWSNNFIDLLKDVDLLVSEAGYYTLRDLIYLSKPAILIPGERRIDNQERRAVEFERKGLGEFFFSVENSKILFNKIKRIIDNPKILEEYSQNYKKLKICEKNLEEEILRELQ